MKTLLLALLLPCYCLGQSICDSLIAMEKDKMTDKVSYGMKQTIILSDDGQEGIGINVIKFEKTLILSLVVADKKSSCLSENTQIIFLFADESKENVLGYNKFNCEGKTNLYFGGGWGKTDLLTTLSVKAIKAIRVYTYKGYMDRELSGSQGEQIKNAILCLKNK